jgi:hypothetical protein
MKQTSGLSGGVVVIQRDFIECILQERILVKGLIADGADSVLGVVEELADVFLGLVVHWLAPNLSSNESLKRSYATNNTKIATSIYVTDRSNEPNIRTVALVTTSTTNPRNNSIIRIGCPFI